MYERIGLQPEASDSEIKKAYRKLSVQYHPDKNKGNAEAEKKFREITEAYEILGDKEKRVIYDSSGIGAVRKMVRRRRRRRRRRRPRPPARPLAVLLLKPRLARRSLPARCSLPASVRTQGCTHGGCFVCARRRVDACLSGCLRARALR